jgi:Protein of unknown function (DUF3054)
MPQPLARLRIAPVLDALAIVSFVLVGGGRHNVHEGIGWFLTVCWPLFLGWFGVALAVRLYSRTSGIWWSLLVTLAGGIAAGAVLRGTFTDRPYVSIFTVIAVTYLGLLTFGWRGVWMLVARSRARRSTPSAPA